MKNPYVIVVGIVCILVVAAAVVTIRMEARKHVFEDHIAGYLELRSSPVIPSQLPIEGRAVVVNAENGSIDSLVLDRLPAELQASTPAEVDIVILTLWTKVQIDSYSDGTPAYQHICSIQIVDTRTRATIRKFDVVGDEPPLKIPERGRKRHLDNEGDRPVDAVAQRVTACYK